MYSCFQIFNAAELHPGPRTVVLQRHNGDFGFTLRHFIVYVSIHLLL